jgi:hypothetical protein
VDPGDLGEFHGLSAHASRVAPTAECRLVSVGCDSAPVGRNVANLEGRFFDDQGTVVIATLHWYNGLVCWHRETMVQCDQN